MTYDQWKTDPNHDITPEQENELIAREECARRGLDPDDVCADGGVTAWMVVAKEMADRVPVTPWRVPADDDLPF